MESGETQVKESLEKQLSMDPEFLRAHASEGPGVYVFKDGSGRPIYVGKAKNLKKRVLSYFKTSGDIPVKTQIMISRAKSLEFILTGTDKEAFILESNLIKKHLPRYNIILRDDKQYPWLRLDPKEPYPSLCIVRKARKDGARYFGPFSSALSVRSTVKLIDRIFHLRKCRERSLQKRPRPCVLTARPLCFLAVEGAPRRGGAGGQTDISSRRRDVMFRKIALTFALITAVGLPATEASAWYRGGRGGYRGGYGYHGGYAYRGGYYGGYRGGYYRPGYGVGAAAAGAALGLGAAAAGAAAAGAYGGNSCYVWNGYNWVWTC